MSNGFTIQLKGFEQVKNAFASLPKEAEKAIEKELKAAGELIVTEAKQNLSQPYPAGATDRGFLKNSISAKVEKLELEVVVNSVYAAYVEFGTRKFAAAYVSTLPSDWQQYANTFKGKSSGGGIDALIKAIMEWVKRKGFAAYRTASGNKSNSKDSKQAQESTAYIIALRILQNGTRAHPYLYPAVRNNVPKLEQSIINAIKNLGT